MIELFFQMLVAGFGMGAGVSAAASLFYAGWRWYERDAEQRRRVRR